MKNNRVHIMSSLFVVLLLLLGGWYVVTKNKNSSTSIILSLPDRDMEWDLTPLGGADPIDLKNKVDDYKKRISSTETIDEKYDLLISLSGTYVYLGDGEGAFHELNNAINLLPEKALAYMNMGNLLRDLGATTTARVAYERGVLKEPQFAQNHLSLLDFYTHTDGISDETIEGAFLEARSRTGEDESVLKEYAMWLEEKGRVDDALSVWETVLQGQPQNKNEIEQKINALKKR